MLMGKFPGTTHEIAWKHCSILRLGGHGAVTGVQGREGMKVDRRIAMETSVRGSVSDRAIEVDRVKRHYR
jgi:hypothetical protein